MIKTKRDPSEPMEKIDYRSIDVKLRKLIKLMNSVPHLKTLYCCQGHPGKNYYSRGYILFTVSDLEILSDVSKLLLHKGLPLRNLLNDKKHDYFNPNPKLRIRTTCMDLEIDFGPDNGDRLRYMVFDENGRRFKKSIPALEKNFKAYLTYKGFKK